MADTSRRQDVQNNNPRPMETRTYHGAAGGWGSLRGISEVFRREMSNPAVLETLATQNKSGGHMCTSCAWGKPAVPHVFEFCENGAKATIWELTRDRCTPDFFAAHTVSELREWSDFDLEMTGRLGSVHRRGGDFLSEAGGRSSA